MPAWFVMWIWSLGNSAAESLILREANLSNVVGQMTYGRQNKITRPRKERLALR